MDNIDIKLIKSNRRTMSLEITGDMCVIVRVPFSAKDSEIDDFIEKHRGWLEKHVEMQKSRIEKMRFSPDTPKEILIEEARRILPPLLEKYTKLMKLYPSGVKITSAKTRLGSCSSDNKVCFSYRLMQFDEKAIEYVVVHELAHIKHHNHGKRFYALIEKYLPDWEERRRILRG